MLRDVLHVHEELPELQALLQRRRQLWFNVGVGLLAEPGRDPRTRLRFLVEHSVTLQSKASSEPLWRIRSIFAGPLRKIAVYKELLAAFGRHIQNFRALISNDSTAINLGIVSDVVQPGDVLFIPEDDRKTSQIGRCALVARVDTRGSYRIVCQAVLLRTHRICPFGLACSCKDPRRFGGERTRLELRMDA